MSRNCAEVVVDAERPGAPAEEDVTGGLHEALALDDPAAVVVVLAGPDERLEHGRIGLLELEEEHVVVVAPLEQDEVTTGADTADADDLEGDVDEPVALEQVPAIVGQR